MAASGTVVTMSCVLRRLNIPPVYPVLYTAAIVLGVFVASGEPVNVLWRPLLISLAITTASLVAVTAATRRRHVAAFLVWAGVAGLATPPVLGLAVLVLLVIVIQAVRRGKTIAAIAVPWAAFTRVLNPLIAIALTIGVASAMASGALTPVPANESAVPGIAPEDAPDIYVLLLDGHPRADTLAEDFGLDISPFLDSMRDLGFQVADSSHSNYNTTILTVSSMLNARPVDELMPPGLTQRADEYRALTASMAQADAVQRLDQAGYSTVAVAPPFGNVTLWNADRLIASSAASDFELSLLQQGLLRHVLPGIQRTWLQDLQRQGILDSFAALESLAAEKTDRPRFVFAHVLAPHPPYVFAADGSPTDGFECFPAFCSMWDRGERYGDAVLAPAAAQVQYIDSLVLRATARIIANSHRPVAIVVMSDHGHRHRAADKDELFRNLFLSYTPGHPDVFPANTTPINVLPRLMNAYLDAGMALAPEGSYWMDVAAEPNRGFLPLEPIDVSQ
jgi:hypothetical protein